MADALKPWHAVAVPHKDIRDGKLDEAVFAANVWAVAQGEGPEVYRDPEQFFRKTYMTGGLGTVLNRVGSALSGGDAGDRIISLQTSFGGGKTHTLVALWHLAKHGVQLRKAAGCDDLRRVLGEKFPDKIRGVAVFTNATCDATQGRKLPDGVHTHTAWGEIAYQLGGKAMYEKIRANDEGLSVPQGLFVDVLKAASPCLILLDELADYCVGAAAIKVGGMTLADQTISFMQHLEEAVQQVPGAVVVATLPASKYEVAQSVQGQEIFVALEKRYGRLAADLKPVADDEIYEVIRRRLFEAIASPGNTEYPQTVARSYVDSYTEHSNEVPSEATKTSYRELIERSYPFHPSVIDALYTRWGSHPDFQRTRGVLRLLGSIVGDLWKRRSNDSQSQPLIQPCHVRWNIDALQAALTRFWGPAFQSVSAADVHGDKSNAALFDEERGGDYARERIGQGMASAILLGSFGGQGAKSGFSAKDLKVACSRPGLNWSYTDGALLELENRCFYLHSTSAGSLGKRYWFGSKPALNMLLVKYRQQVARDTFDADSLQALRLHAAERTLGGAAWRVIVDPAADLPEQKSLTLLVLPPTLAWGDDSSSQEAVRKRVLELSTRCGQKERHYRNTLLFLAPTARGIAKLRAGYRERAALRGVQTDYSSQLDDEQRADLKGRIDAAEAACVQALGPAYTVVLRVEGSSADSVSLSDARSPFPEHLGYVWTVLVEDEEWILRRVGSVTLGKVGLVPKESGHRVKDAVETFLRYTDKPIVATKDAVTAGLAQACKDGVIGIGRGPSITTLQARYCREVVPLDPSEEGLWIIPPFEAQPAAAGAGARGSDSSGPGPGGDTGNGPPVPAGGGATPKPTSTTTARRVRQYSIQGDVPLENWAEIFRCFIQPAARMHLRKLRLGIHFEGQPAPENPIPVDDAALKSMREAAKQLGLTFNAEDADGA
jgi:hypothetical protein